MQPPPITRRVFYALRDLVTVAIVFLWLALPSSVGAQARLESGGMDLHLFRPAVDSKGFLSVNGTEVLGANDISFGLILDVGAGVAPFEGFVNDSMVTSPDEDRRSRLIDAYFTGTLQFNYGIANRAVVGLQLPIHVIGGENITVPGSYNSDAGDGLRFQGIGNLSLHGKVRLTRVDRDPVGVAALLHVELPTGTDDAFAGEPGFALWPTVAVEYRPIPRIRLGGNLGYRYNSGDGAEDFPSGGRADPPATNATCDAARNGGIGCVLANMGQTLTYDDLVTFGLAASFRVARAWDLVAEFYGTQLVGEQSRAGLSMEVLGGFKIFVERNSYLALAGGIGIPSDGFQQADYRGVAAFIFEPSVGDRDGDGLKDDIDQCPDDPEDFDGYQDEDGCPDPDNDGDGILDVDDECPLVPEDFDGDADHDGCPEGEEGDRDGDGIPDHLDRCPDDPEDFDGFEDEDGCPDPDNDKDGILDKDDLCPNDPEDRDGFEDEDGCPDPDNDADRILDQDDACPNDPETYNGHKDEDGCPDEGSVIVDENQIIILEKIYFETDSAVIQKRSYPIVEAVAATLNGNPHIALVEIQGHADERASDKYNIRLTRARAQSVLEALVRDGVKRDRLRSAGYGERCPVDPRHNPTAWEANRRVEFKIIRTDDGPTGVEVACPAGKSLIPK